MTTATSPCSPYDFIGQEEASEAREKYPAEDATKKDRATTQTNPLQDTGKRYTAGPPSPTDPRGCLTLTYGPRSKRKYVLDQLTRVKRIIVRSASL